MLCHNCNYILSGKENFCPNCGTMPEGRTDSMFTTKEVAKDKKNEVEVKEEKEPVVIYPKDEPEEIPFKDVNIFYESDEQTDLSDEKKDRKAPTKIFLLLFLTCALSVTAFGLADYFGITPTVKNLVQTLSQKKYNISSDEASPYSHESSIIEPDINYSMSDAYIMSGNGLTLRKGPGNGYAPIHNLTDLTRVHIFGGSIVNKNWVYVYCPEKESYGWLNGSFLATEQTASAVIPDEEADYEDSFTYNETLSYNYLNV